jgi:hypothetical protein
MLQTTPTVSPVTAIFNLFGRWFKYSRVAGRNQPDISDGPGPNSMDERPDYGAYNEAFIVHNWASFGPRF